MSLPLFFVWGLHTALQRIAKEGATMTDKPFSNETDKGHLKQFSEEAGRGARDPWSGTPEELKQRHERLEKEEAERQATVNNEPVPTGEGEDIHAGEPALPKDTEITPDRRSDEEKVEATKE